MYILWYTYIVHAAYGLNVERDVCICIGWELYLLRLHSVCTKLNIAMGSPLINLYDDALDVCTLLFLLSR